MSDSDNPSSPKKEEMDVSENGDAGKPKGDSDHEDSKVEESKPTKKEEANEESDEEEDDEEPPLGLLERPVELTSGKREKKKVERLEVTINLPNSERKKVDIPEGKGVKLGECPRIEFKLNHTKAIDLKPLHRLLFSKPGSNMEVKKNIRQFSGFTFLKGDKEYEKRVTSLNKLTVAGLKHLCEVLDIERGGTKPAIIERIMDFLMKPSSSGLRVPEKKKRKSKGGDGDKKATKRKRAPKKKETKSKSSKDLGSDISDSDDIEEEEEEEEEEKEKKSKSASEEEEEEEEEEEPPKKKAKVEKKSSAKKEAAKKETPKAKKQNGKQEKAVKAEKKEPKKKKKALDSDEDSDSDDEPLAPKKNEPPSNSELKDVIKKILDGANLEEVTMKTVVKQVYEKYPSFDLTDRKDFIKTTVREIIS